LYVIAPLPLIRGTLDLLVLRALSWGPMHGFEITTWLEDRSGGRLGVDDRALYQSLQRLEARGLVHAHWGMTENNRRARYYQVSAAGTAHLRAETSQWLEYSETVTQILTVAQGPVARAAT
jgi:PadR family transcriptional regulator, regulatory protein PadR